MERNDRTNQDRMRNQEQDDLDVLEQGSPSGGDHDKMSDYDRASEKTRNLRTEEREKIENERQQSER